MELHKVDVIDVDKEMEVVYNSGLDDALYESTLNDLRKLQRRYNHLVDYVTPLVCKRKQRELS